MAQFSSDLSIEGRWPPFKKQELAKAGRYFQLYLHNTDTSKCPLDKHSYQIWPFGNRIKDVLLYAQFSPINGPGNFRRQNADLRQQNKRNLYCILTLVSIIVNEPSCHIGHPWLQVRWFGQYSLA